MKYTGAGGEHIENKGEGPIQAKSDEGINVDLTAQVGDKMKRLLIAVNKATEAGNMVVFGGNLATIKELAKRDSLDENFIVSKKTLTTSRVHEKRGLYVYPLWIRRKKGLDPIQSVEDKSNECQPCCPHDSDPFDIVAPF